MPAELPVMLHDADCGFCAQCARLVPRLGCRIRVASLQSEDLDALGVDRERAIVEMPVVTSTGRVAWGHEAWAEILLTGPLPARVAGRMLASRLVRRPAAAVYRWVAENRHRLPGGSASCAMPAPPAQK